MEVEGNLKICGCLRVDDGGAENHGRNDSHERARLFQWPISSIELVNDFYRSEYFAHTSICNCHGDVNYCLGLAALGGAKGLLEDVCEGGGTSCAVLSFKSKP